MSLFLSLLILAQAMAPAAYAGFDDINEEQMLKLYDARVRARAGYTARLNLEVERNRYGTLNLITRVPVDIFRTQIPKSGTPATVLALIEITDGVIRGIRRVSAEQAKELEAASSPERPVLVLEDSVAYPGFINLHNHTKQNVLPLWDGAKGQFDNRHEWRDYKPYEDAVMGNVKPWAAVDGLETAAVYRWSELQAMIQGTTYLQGPSRYVENFGIHRVEDADAYKVDDKTLKKLPVTAPMELFPPKSMPFVWNAVRLEMLTMAAEKGAQLDGKLDAARSFAEKRQTVNVALVSGVTYEQALDRILRRNCKTEWVQSLNGVFSDVAEKSLAAGLVANCGMGTLPPGAVEYFRDAHPTISSKRRYLLNPNRSAAIFHLAEGRPDDKLTQVEFELIRIMGMDLPGMNFVHASGVDAAGFERMAEQQMGLVWSPFSNLLLYGDTTRVGAAKRAGVVLALGSDWTPTGSKTVLEELQMAWKYIQKDPQKEGLKDIFSPYDLYKMITENPARLIGQLEVNATDGRHGVGVLKTDAMGSLAVFRLKDRDPYLNLLKATEADVRLVTVDGKPIYGDESVIRTFQERAQPADSAKAPYSYEQLPADAPMQGELNANGLKAALNPNSEEFKTEFAAITNELQDVFMLDAYAKVGAAGTFIERMERLNLEAAAMARTVTQSVLIGRAAARTKFKTVDFTEERCGFREKKAFVYQNVRTPEITSLAGRTGVDSESRRIDLNRFTGIQRLIGVNLLTQSRNAWSGNPWSVTAMPALYSCNDLGEGNGKYLNRVGGFLNPSPTDQGDEYGLNLSGRETQRNEHDHLGADKAALETLYGI